MMISIVVPLLLLEPVLAQVPSRDVPAQTVAVRTPIKIKAAHAGNLVITALLSGYWVVQLMGDDWARLEFSGGTFAETQSLANKRLGVAFPVMMVTNVLSHLAVMGVQIYEGRAWTKSFFLTGVGLICSIVMVITTSLINVPVNNQTSTWTSTDYPADWADYRSRWHTGHMIRTGLSIPMLAASIASALLED